MDTAIDILRYKGSEITTVEKETTIFDTLKLLIQKKIGAVCVTERGKICGIWTERDLMRNALTENFDPKITRVGDVMTLKLQAVPFDMHVYNLMDRFLGLRLRHLLVEKDGEYIGLLSSGDIQKALLHEKYEELEKMNAEASWGYYEDWKWADHKIVKPKDQPKGLRVELNPD